MQHQGVSFMRNVLLSAGFMKKKPVCVAANFPNSQMLTCSFSRILHTIVEALPESERLQPSSVTSRDAKMVINNSTLDTSTSDSQTSTIVQLLLRYGNLLVNRELRNHSGSKRKKSFLSIRGPSQIPFSNPPPNVGRSVGRLVGWLVTFSHLTNLVDPEWTDLACQILYFQSKPPKSNHHETQWGI